MYGGWKKMSEKLPDCAQECIYANSSCKEAECRMWIDYEEDRNCTLIAIDKQGPMTLNEISKRMDLSIVRISQIEKETLRKIKKRIKI